MAGALTALALPSASRPIDRTILAASVTAFGLLGLTEDLRGISPLSRLSIQVAVAVLFAPLILRSMEISIFWQVIVELLTVVWLVAYVNAFNFMDGINGIGLGQVIVAGVTWSLIGGSRNVQILIAAGMTGTGAALGFTFFNFPRARMFLGDVGSYSLGAWLSAVAIFGLKAGIPADAMVAPLSVFLVDTGSTLVRRAFSGQALCQPHRCHAYQRLVDLGWSHTRTTLSVVALMGVCSGLGAVSLISSISARIAADIALAGLLVGYVAAPSYLKTRYRRVTSGSR